MEVKSIIVKKSRPVTVRSVAGAEARSMRTAIRRVLHLRGTKYRVVHYAIPAVRTTGTVGRVGGRVRVPLITSVRFSCGVTVTTVRGKTSGVHVGPKGVNTGRQMRTMMSGTGRCGIPVHINMGDNSLRGRLLRGCNNIATRKVIRDTLSGIRLVRSVNCSGLIIDVGSSSILVYIGTRRLVTGRYPCPLRIKVARSKAMCSKGIGSSMKLKVVLRRKVNGAVHISLAKSPMRRVHATGLVLGALKLHGKNVRIMSYPAYKEAEVGLVGLTGRMRRVMTSVPLSVGITIVKYIMGKPKRTGRTSVKVTKNVKRKLLVGGNRVIGGMGRRRLLSALERRLLG